jgi:ATP-dependent DNA helicase RecQ
MPTTKKDFMAIKGVGQKKFENYGEIFIEIIEKYIKDKNIETKAVAIEIETESDTNGKDRYDLTYDAYLKSDSLDQIASIRNYTTGTIINHFDKIINEKGKIIDLDRFINKKAEVEVLEMINKEGFESKKVLKDNCSDFVTYDDISLVMIKHQI